MLDWIAQELGARGVRRTQPIQPLWSGYGELFRIELDGGPTRTAVVKWARPPSAVELDASATRKLRSFEVEAAFYRTIACRCGDSFRVPALLASRRDGRDSILVLEDLDAAGYATRVDEANPTQLETALAWLAGFHARFLGERSEELWSVGSYWHLETRRDELAAIEDDTLRSAAPGLAARLDAARFQTIVHGDPKEANFCFTADGTAAAAVDFQYTGAGCGMRDVAYLLYGRSDEPPDGIDHARLDIYFRQLRGELRARGDSVDLDALEAEWRVLYPIARLDFCRFLAGWRPAMWRVDKVGRRFVRARL